MYNLKRNRAGTLLSRLCLIAVFLMGTTRLSAQQRNVTGTVTDAAGPVAGVAVTVKGTSLGVITNARGEYSISASPESVLVFSFVGYEPLEETVGERVRINVVLTETTTAIDDVVYIGYGTVRKRDLIGAVSSIKGEEITLTPTTNVMQALQGKISGMDIMQTSGAIGQDVDVLLRGTRSIYGSNEPLYIIDGISGSINQLSPQDIESIDVLKDASSTAVYGSAGANGVVIVTTKKGIAGKTRVNFNSYFGFSGNPAFKHGMVGDEYIEYQREYYKTTHSELYPQSNEDLFNSEAKKQAYRDGKWIDWVDKAMKGNATQQNYNLSVTGGNDNTKVFTSMNYSKENGMLSNEDRSRFNLHFNVDHKIRDWVSFGTTTQGTYTIQNNRASNIFTRALSAFPLGDVYDEHGNINQFYIDSELTPLGDMIPDQYKNERRNTYIKTNLYAEFTPLPGLSYKTIVGGSLSANRQGYYVGEGSIQNVSGYSIPYANITNSFSYGYTWENIVTYNKTFAEKHNMVLTGVASWGKSQQDNSELHASGQPQDYYLFYNMSTGTAQQGLASGYTQTQSMSFVARANYSYKGKYLASFTTRWDGASHLASGHKWDYFPAGGVAWRISDESFMENTRRWLDDAKIRVSYGVTGNAGGMGAYSSQTGTFTYSQYVSIDGGLTGISQLLTPYGNPGLGWEKSYTFDIGLDLSILRNRIELVFDYYNTNTKDLLFSRQLPATSAITAWGSPLSTWQNIGQTNNRGFEVTLTSRNIMNRDFKWTSTVTLTHNKEKITKLPDGDLVASKLFEGHPVKAQYDYKYLGIWKQAEEEEAAKYGRVPGSVKVQTIEQTDDDGLNGDGGYHNYTDADKMILGANSPRWIIGFSNAFQWKNFDLNIFAIARYGQMIQSSLLGWYNTTGDNQISGIKYYTPERENVKYPRPGISSIPDQSAGNNSFTYQNGSFIKIKNITLGYSFPTKKLEKAGISRARLYVTAYNPIIIPISGALKGTDPENNGSDTFPLYRTYVVGLNFSF